MAEPESTTDLSAHSSLAPHRIFQVEATKRCKAEKGSMWTSGEERMGQSSRLVLEEQEVDRLRMSFKRMNSSSSKTIKSFSEVISEDLREGLHVLSVA